MFFFLTEYRLRVYIGNAINYTTLHHLINIHVFLIIISITTVAMDLKRVFLFEI